MLTTVCILLSIPYGLWLFYLAIENLIRARRAGTLSKTAYILGLPLFAIGVLLDIITNTFILSALLLEIPHEATVTARLRRHIQDGNGWRSMVARWLCKNLIDTFDPSGSHCQ